MDRPARSRLLPDTATVGDPTGQLCRSAGVDMLDLAARVRHAAVRLRRGPPPGPLPRGRRRASADGVNYATKAFLCRAMARLAHEEGLRLDVATGGELHVALAAGVPADRLVLHGNNKSTAELRRALRAGVGRIVVDSFDELDRIEALVAEGLPAPAGADPRHPRRRGPHPRVRPHRPGRLQVRLRRCRPGTAARGRASGPRRRPSVELVGLHAHIGSPGLRGRNFFERPSRSWPRSSTRHDLPELVARRRPRRGLRRGGGGADHHRVGRGRAGRAARRRASRPPSPPSRAGPSSPPAAVTLYTVGTIKDIPGIRTYVAVDGGMSDNPRPVLYGSGYETFLPRAVDADRDPPGPRGGQALRVRRPARPRRPGARPTSPSATCSPRRSPGLRPLHGLQLQQGHPPGGGVRGRRRRPSVVRRETLDDLLVARRRLSGTRFVAAGRAPVAWTR